MAAEAADLHIDLPLQIEHPHAQGQVITRPGVPAATYFVAKRTLDVVAASVLLLVLLPVFVLISIAVAIDSGGPAFYRGTRVGRHGRLFTALKFRSMVSGADQMPHRTFIRELMEGADCQTLYKVNGDKRITRVGAFLRRTSLDELPQLWNVIRGDMSLVGPRPDVPYAVEIYEPWMRRRLEATPGMTGLWQVSGRSRVGLRDMLRLDVEYVDRRSLALDARILMLTLPAVLSGDGAA